VPPRGAPTVLIQNHPSVSTSTNLAAIGSGDRREHPLCRMARWVSARGQRAGGYGMIPIERRVDDRGHDISCWWVGLGR
jgi:hypothetical protein